MKLAFLLSMTKYLLLRADFPFEAYWYYIHAFLVQIKYFFYMQLAFIILLFV